MGESISGCSKRNKSAENKIRAHTNASHKVYT